MTDFLSAHHLLGLAIGLATFLIIGLFHPLVIKGEYYFGVRCWWAFLILGIATGILSYFSSDLFLSILLGVISFSSFWSIGEVFEQRQRVRKGWFPANPHRQ
ncbi:MAG: DUF4491 family protein [Bacteroides sp.]|nr:DUF4491 family protein [Bacteroides sp.]MCM1095574.1 DUF4491 family protein [Terasakiella sp.]